MALLIVGAATWMSSEVVYGTVERLALELGRPDESWRIRIWSDALALWQSAPVLGTGLATFGVAFPSFRSIEAPVVFTHAESDWVQLLTDTGIVGLGLAIMTIGAVSLRLWGRSESGQGKGSRLLRIAGFVALGGAAVQGLGNYNFALMSNFIYLILAIVVAHSDRIIVPRSTMVRPELTVSHVANTR
jgi:O-antigen ligase